MNEEIRQQQVITLEIRLQYDPLEYELRDKTKTSYHFGDKTAVCTTEAKI